MAMPILLAAALQSVQPQPAYGPVDWLAQDLVCRAEMLASGPVWRFLEIGRQGDMLTGRFGTSVWRDAGEEEVRPEGRLRIDGREGRLLLTYAPDHDVATEYRLVRSDREGAIFETSARAVPQRIAFRSSMVGVTVTMSQLDGSAATSTYYSRRGLHIGIRSCDGSR